MHGVLCAAIVSGVALASAACCCCDGASAERVSAFMVGKAVEVTKGATTGVANGFDEGRQAAPSVDEAIVVTSAAEYRAASGIARLVAITDIPGASATSDAAAETDESVAAAARIHEASANHGEKAPECEIVIALVNNGMAPIRAVHIAPLVLDRDGHVVEVTKRADDTVTIPPRASVVVTIRARTSADQVGSVRVYDVDATKDVDAVRAQNW